jgi:RNA polymerase sigma factor (sigma-70 family)
MTATAARERIEWVGRFSDAELVRECLRGSEAAWSTLIDKYKNLIFSIPVRYGFSQEDSADIFQSVCIDLLTELPGLREPNALAGWLIRVARNKCYHRKQALQRTVVQQHDLDDMGIAVSQAEPESAVSQIEHEQMLRQALADLPSRCLKLVQMLFFEVPARPYEEVARELELASGSIGFIRRRCLDKLRARLSQMGL